MSKYSILLIISFFLFFSDTNGQQYIDSNILKRSVVKLQHSYKERYDSRRHSPYTTSRDIDGNVLITNNVGTGFFITNNHLVTNCHVLRNREDELYIGGFGSTNISVRSDRPLRLYAASPEHDVCVLYSYDVEGVPILPFSKSSIEDQERVTVMGYPDGMDFKITQGSVIGSEFIDETKTILITNPIEPGSSGSPVFDDYGNLVGILTATIGSFRNANVVVSIEHLIETLDKVQIDIFVETWGTSKYKELFKYNSFEQAVLGLPESSAKVALEEFHQNLGVEYDYLFADINTQKRNSNRNRRNRNRHNDGEYLEKEFKDIFLNIDSDVLTSIWFYNQGSNGELPNVFTDITSEGNILGFELENDVDSTLVSRKSSTFMIEERREYVYTFAYRTLSDILNFWFYAECKQTFLYKRNISLEFSREEALNDCEFSYERIVLQLSNDYRNDLIEIHKRQISY